MKSVECFEPSTTVLTCYPYVSLLSRGNRGQMCDDCFKTAELTPCSECSVFKYCSISCQKNNSKIHEYECKVLRKDCSRMENISDEAIFLLRLYYFSQSNDGEKVVEKVFDQKRAFSDLMSHEENLKKDEKRLKEFGKLSMQMERFVYDVLSIPYSKMLLMTFGKMVINSFSILDDNLNSIGTGLYLGASTLDHSCNPNCVVTFSGTQICLRSNRWISQNDLLTISYIEQMNTTRRRQQELEESYYFSCKCNYCLDAVRDVSMIGLHPGLAPQEDEDTIHEEYLQMENKLQSLKKHGESADVYSLSKNFFSKWSKKLTPKSVYVYQCMDLYFDACIDLEMWDKIVPIGQKLIKLHSYYIPEPHPKRAVDSLKYAKVLLFLRLYKKAMEYFKKSEEEIRALFGKESQITQTLNNLKYQCMVEGREFTRN